MANLTIMTGEQAGTTFEIASRPLSIGRDSSRDIQIMDMKASRKHGVVRFADPDYVISPLKTINPILVNGDPIGEQTPLKEGDEVTVGNTLLRFSMQGADGYTNAVNHLKDNSPRARDANTMM